MPEMQFRVRWPDGQIEDCYSPSTIVREHFAVGTDYPLSEFADRAQAALSAANDRVRDKFGMGCSQALNQLVEIERKVARFADVPGAVVRVEGFVL